ncbi:MAG: hypothetical protein R3B93_18055 [Bacteroidia bacterium]
MSKQENRIIMDEKEKWIEDVFQSMKGSKKAQPRPELLAKIEDQITDSREKVIPMRQWKYAAAAAVVIIFMNVSALLYYNQTAKGTYEDVAAAEVYSKSLISNYKIYE